MGRGLQGSSGVLVMVSFLYGSGYTINSVCSLCPSPSTCTLLWVYVEENVKKIKVLLCLLPNGFAHTLLLPESPALSQSFPGWLPLIVRL